MQIKVTITVDIPDWLDEGKCIGRVPSGYTRWCDHLLITAFCDLFKENITRNRRCPACVKACKEAGKL